MDSNLDKNFKDAFQNFELPYNANAWTALNEKLDQVQPISAPKSAPNNKWKWITGGTVAILSIGALLWSLSNNATTSSREASQTPMQANSNVSSSESTAKTSALQNNAVDFVNQKNGNTTLNKNTEVEKSKVVVEQSTNQQPKIGVTENQYISKNGPGVFYKEEKSPDNSENLSPLSNNQEFNDQSFVFPIVTGKLCEHAQQNLTNKNKSDLLLYTPSGEKITIRSQATVNVKLNETGIYTMVNRNDEAKRTSFIVYESPKTDFTLEEEMAYENGLPITTLQAMDASLASEWVIGKTTYSGDAVAPHFYKKGSYPIRLTQTDENGCKSTVQKDIFISETYNLLAPTGFMPLSSDERKSHFIPIALKLRKVAFKMVVIEPRSGKIIFETSSTEGWNGFDSSTGQLVQENNSYIWKVILLNPEKGEPSEYSGIVVRL